MFLLRWRWLRAAGLVGASALGFGALRWALGRTPQPEYVRRDPTRLWRWKNLLVSFVHSVVAGVWAVAGVWRIPGGIFADLVHASSPSGHLLLCVSAGYFIHDSLDIIVCHQSRASWEYLVHHAMAVTGLFSGIYLERFVAAGLVSLFVEVSNIFLTMRMMMRLGRLPFHTFYEVNKYVNLVMYFLFRLFPQAYLTWYFVRFVEMRGQGAFLMVNLVLLDGMILVYFSRLLRSDFCPDTRKQGPDSERKFLND
ncbi:TLC domain-containing protein 1 [Sceloporus undulatus]|uniref:TLC domain-containing protein 1 n=1 Tax=Sceloporus undulatus TaxID=8520 RepID=UPI001C4D3167|nr:TLC domain-containing protein 1 [Sceloporus undulatus]